jgi:alpha-L-fucosidase
MRSRVQIRVLTLLWACASAFGQPQNTRLQWLRDAKFGLVVHWGLYSVPAGEWKGQPIAGPGEWIMHDARIPVKEYQQFASRFNPPQFDAEAWVKVAEEAGAKYLVFSAKGKDGFAMYRSAVSKYNVFDGTPFHRDPLKELAAACAKHHIRLGVYYSLAEDWNEPNGAGNDWDFGTSPKDFDQYLRAKAEPQIKELLTGYGPVSVVSFGAPGAMSDPQRRRFVELVHSLQPAALVDGSIGPMGDYRSLADTAIPPTIEPGDWQVASTVNHTGAFKKFDNAWKSPSDLTFTFLDVVSKGGSYVLNIGATAEGIIPRPIPVTLKSLGDWLEVNGEAIHGAGPTTIGFSPAWRCTTKPGKLFVTVFDWPDAPLEISQVPGKVNKAYLLADKSRALLKVTQAGGKVAVVLPKDPPLEFEIPERVNPRFAKMAARVRVRCVVVLETQPN